MHLNMLLMKVYANNQHYTTPEEMILEIPKLVTVWTIHPRDCPELVPD